MTDRWFTSKGRRFQPPSPEMEAEIVNRFKEGDEEAVDLLLSFYWDDLLRFADRILVDRDQAEDVVQEAFVRLWNGRSTWERKDTLRPVLHRIVRNLALNEKRRLTTLANWIRRARLFGREPERTPLDEVEEAQLQRVIRRAVDGLPERRRQVFLLIRYQHMSYREAADALGVSLQTVANHMSLAMKDLRTALDPDSRPDDRRDIPFPRAGNG